MNRRRFLGHGLALLSVLSPGSGCTTQFRRKAVSRRSAPSSDSSLLLSACTDMENQHYVAGLTLTGDVSFMLPVPHRAHDSIAVQHRQEVIFFGRSPADVFYVVDVNNKVITHRVSAGVGRHFFGHGVLDEQGFLYVSENEKNNNIPGSIEQGYIGVYDTNHNYSKINSFPSYGMEPHQILLLPDAQTLVIANGGLIKRRDVQGRKIIENRNNFESSVVYVNTRTGQLEGKVISEHAGNSLRHVTLGAAGEVYIAAQSYADEVWPLLYQHELGGPLQPFIAEDYIWQRHNKYVASLAFSNGKVIMTSPTGNLYSLWDAVSMKYIVQQGLVDVAGVTVAGSPSKPQFVLSSGNGALQTIDSGVAEVRALGYFSGFSWDNHLSVVGEETS